MKPFFIKSSVDKISYLRGDEVINKPVNLSLCLSVHKDRLRWYPDNNGRPSIVFKMIPEGKELTWAYDKEIDRNLDYEKIVNNEFINEGGNNIE